MKIVIPMSGIGKRFLDAGYKKPKPLIEVDGIPMIQHVVNMFPGETDFIFICNRGHLQQTDMREILRHVAPTGKIVEIDSHKLGPAFAVKQALHLINDDEEVIINYCDFAQHWNYQEFLEQTRVRNADGAIPAYRGFHPHMLGTDQYAFLKTDENQRVLAIQEKKPFTDNRLLEFASSGTYYFRRGSYAKDYITALMEKGEAIQGEYYISGLFNFMLEDGLKVFAYEIEHMLQWGTPKDLEEYNFWSNFFKSIVQWEPVNGPENLYMYMLAAGRGQRFQNSNIPKVLSEVCGKPITLQALEFMPRNSIKKIIGLTEHKDQWQQLKKDRDLGFIFLDGVTKGQACTAEIGVKEIEKENPDASMIIGACDVALLYDPSLLFDKKSDVIVWTFRNSPFVRLHPKMYSYVRVQGDKAVDISLKMPFTSCPWQEHAIAGSFYFRSISVFKEGLARLYKKTYKEYYIDSLVGELIEAGYTVRTLEVSSYAGWGTPAELNSFLYWQRFFHKCAWHPYSIKRDPLIDSNIAHSYEDTFKKGFIYA